MRALREGRLDSLDLAAIGEGSCVYKCSADYRQSGSSPCSSCSSGFGNHGALVILDLLRSPQAHGSVAAAQARAKLRSANLLGNGFGQAIARRLISEVLDSGGGGGGGDSSSNSSSSSSATTLTTLCGLTGDETELCLDLHLASSCSNFGDGKEGWEPHMALSVADALLIAREVRGNTAPACFSFSDFPRRTNNGLGNLPGMVTLTSTGMSAADFTDWRLSQASAIMVAAFLPRMTDALTSVLMLGSQIGAEGSLALSSALAQCSALTTIDLSRNGIVLR